MSTLPFLYESIICSWSFPRHNDANRVDIVDPNCPKQVCFSAFRINYVDPTFSWAKKNAGLV